MTSAKKLSVTEFPTYEEYKDSGVEWLGEVPKEWEVTRLKNFSKIFNGATPSSSTEIFWDGGITWVTPVDIDGSMYVYQSKRTISRAGYSSCGTTLVPENSVIITCRAPIGKVALAGNKLCTNQGCKSLVISKDVEHKFVYYYFSISQRLLNSFGSGTTFLELSSEALKNFMVCLPSYKEQTLIAQFLDQKTALIDQAIAIKEQQIKLLNERKQIIIQQAVTQGLNPNAPMKDSGVEWIGQIPEHWGVRPLKFGLKINNGQDHKNVLTESGYPVYGSGGRFAFASKYLYDGEALLLGRKGTIDRPLYVYGKFWTVDTMFYAICNKKYLTKFAYYFATTIPFSYYATSTALPSMTQYDLNNHQAIYPPVEEQRNIISFLDTSLKELMNLINLKEREIQALKEYKTTLINSAVTGKIKITQAMLTEVKEVGYAE